MGSKVDLAQATSKGESDLESAPPNDTTTRTGTHPTFLGRAHGCVSGIWGLLVIDLTIV
jgi:hypothetical protein